MARINYARLYTLRKDGRYQGKYKDAQGKWHSVCDKDPERLHRRLEELTTPPVVTFADAAEAWEAKHRPEVGDKTWLNYAPHVADIVGAHGSRPVEELSAQDVINDLTGAHARGMSATIISTRRSIYRMILDHALAEGHIRYNPAVGVKLPRGIVRNRREAPEAEVIRKILGHPEAPFAQFAVLLLCTGLRRAEALALTWGDIGETHISVNKALDYTVHAHPTVKLPKTKSGIRIVPIIEPLRPFLVRPKGARNTDLLFPGTPSARGGAGGGHMTEHQYRGKWGRYCAAVGLVDGEGKPLITAHNLRHGTATLLFEAGVDELTAQSILGHASPTTTREIYTHLRAQHKDSMVRRFDDLVSALVAE